VRVNGATSGRPTLKLPPFKARSRTSRSVAASSFTHRRLVTGKLLATTTPTDPDADIASDEIRQRVNALNREMLRLSEHERRRRWTDYCLRLDEITSPGRRERDEREAGGRRADAIHEMMKSE